MKHGRKQPRDKHMKGREWRLNQHCTQENQGLPGKSLWSRQSIWGVLRIIGVMILTTGEKATKIERRDQNIM